MSDGVKLSEDDIIKMATFSYLALLSLINFEEEEIDCYVKTVSYYQKILYIISNAVKRDEETRLLMRDILDKNQKSYKDN